MGKIRLVQKQYLASYLFLLLAVLTFTWALWNFFTRRVPGGNDFMAHYSVWQAYLRMGFSPYSDEAALYTQKLIYGRQAFAGEDQNRLTYPFYSLIFHAPFTIFPYPLARAIYMTVLILSLIASVNISLVLVNWRPAQAQLALLIAWALLFYPHARGLILGQFAILGFISLAGSLYLLKKGRDFLAGIILVASTVKPTLVFLVLPFLLIYIFVKRRIKFLAGFGLSMSILMAGSFWLQPGWFQEWLQRVSLYSEYTVGESPVWLITHEIIPELNDSGELILTTILLAGVFYAWWKVFQQNSDSEFLWTTGITIVVSNLIVTRSATTNYVMMLMTTIWILAALSRKGILGKTVAVSALIVSIPGYWWLHFITVKGNQEQAVMFLPYPIIIGLTLVFGRKWLMKDERNLKDIG